MNKLSYPFKGLLVAMCLQFFYVAAMAQQCQVSLLYTNNSPFYFTFYAIDSMQCVPQGATYSWTFGDGQTGTGNQVGHQYSTAAIGSYNVCVTVSAPGFTITQCTIVSTGSVPCNPTLTGNQIPGSVLWTFSANDPDNCLPANPVFNWSFGDGSDSASGQTVTHSFSAPGSYIVCYSVAGTNITKCKIVNVTSTPCNVTAVATPVAGGTYSFSINDPSQCLSATGVTYLWNFGDNTTGQGKNVYHTYTASGTYSACVNIIAGNTTTQTCVTVNVVIAPPTSVWIGGRIQVPGDSCFNGLTAVELIGIDNNTYQTMTANGAVDSCYYFFSQVETNKKYVIRATPLNAGPSGSYLPTYYGDQVFWSEAAVIQPVDFTYNLNITLQQSLWSVIGGGTGTISGVVSGNGTVVTTSFNGSNISTTFNAQRSHAIVLNSANEPIGFAYVNSDGSFSFSNLPNGQYSLRIENPKVNSVTIPVTVSSAAPNVNVQVTATSTGIDLITSNGKRIKASEVVVWPNPASSTLMLSGVQGDVAIINAQGQVVLHSTGTTLNISQLANGIYTIKAMNHNREPVTTRFIKN